MKLMMEIQTRSRAGLDFMIQAVVKWCSQFGKEWDRDEDEGKAVGQAGTSGQRLF